MKDGGGQGGGVVGVKGAGWCGSRGGSGLGWRSREWGGRAPTPTTSPHYPYTPTTLYPSTPTP